MSISISGLWVYLNRELTQIKKGHTAPVMWSSVDEYSAEMLTFENPHAGVDQFNINLTDFYVLPELNRLHFGFWYKKWTYNTVDDETPRLVFSMSLVDQDGHMYPANRFVISESMSLYETFQYRSVEDIDIHTIDTLTLKIELLERGVEEDQVVDHIEFVIYDAGVHHVTTFDEKQ